LNEPFSKWRAIVVALGCLAATPAFLLFANYILNHFYRHGALLFDSGALAQLAWRDGWSLPTNPVFGEGSYFRFHIAPVFVLLSGLSALLPLSMTQFFALVTGLAHGALAVAVFWLLARDYRWRRGGELSLALFLAMAFSFNGLALAQIRYPHFEILIAAGALLFLVAWFERRFALAALFFVLTLSCREDAGFHLAAALALVAALNWRNGVPLAAQKATLWFLAAGFAYSLAAALLGLVFNPGQSSFARVYLGAPAYAHLSAHLIVVRLIGYVMFRAYIFLPAAVAVVWAIAARNPYLTLGYAAFVPWTLLHLLAKGDLAGSLSSYYGFPYLIASFWPLIGWLIERRRRGLPLAVAEPALGFAAMIAASFAALSAQHDPSHMPLLAGMTQPADFAEEARVDRAVTALRAAHPVLGRVLAADSVVSLDPLGYRRDETFWSGDQGSADTVLYFADDRDRAAVATAIAHAALDRRYAVAGTPLRIASNRDLSALPALGALLDPDRDER
jgi:hypothetical protein